IRADLAALNNDAQRLAIAPAADLAHQAAAPQDFAHSLREAVRSVDQEEQAAAERMAAVDSGKSDDLVGAMLASQQASLSFSMLVQVRNKVMGAVD
ncbi:MAG: flagellar hook-basal body complex protein FliE, partial [Gammaproteobacteria bacterium]